MFLILVLSIFSSSTDFVFAENISEEIKIKPTAKSFTVDLTEKMGFTEIKKKLKQNNVHSVSLQERLSAATVSEKDQIIFVKHESDRKMMMERISDRNSKSKLIDSRLVELSSSSLAYHEHDEIVVIDTYEDLSEKAIKDIKKELRKWDKKIDTLNYFADKLETKAQKYEDRGNQDKADKIREKIPPILAEIALIEDIITVLECAIDFTPGLQVILLLLSFKNKQVKTEMHTAMMINHQRHQF